MGIAHRRSGETFEKHLRRFFSQREMTAIEWDTSPLRRAFKNFSVLRFSPSREGELWVYVSSGAAQVPSSFGERYEFLILSHEDDASHIETISMVASFNADHRYQIYPGKVLSIGRPWMKDSNLDHLLVSLPYPLGPEFERCESEEGLIRVLWLQPIAASEATLIQENGLDFLEQKFDAMGIDYAARSRPIATESDHGSDHLSN